MKTAALLSSMLSVYQCGIVAVTIGSTDAFHHYGRIASMTSNRITSSNIGMSSSLLSMRQQQKQRMRGHASLAPNSQDRKRPLLSTASSGTDRTDGCEHETEQNIGDTNSTSMKMAKIDEATASNKATDTNEYPKTPTLKECLAFVLPALGIYVCSPLMSLIDASFIGRASSTELAALGPASTISDSAPYILLFLSIGSTNLIAKSYAQNDENALARVSRTALGMGAIGGAFVAALLYSMAGPISSLYCGAGAGAEVLAPFCTKYVAIRALALPAVVMTMIAQAICIGTKDTKSPMISVFMAGILNLIGDFVLVKWLQQGIAGAAWATSLSQVLSAGLLLRVLKERGFLQKQKSTQSGGNEDDENATTKATVKQLLSFIPFLFVMAVKIGWHNSCSATAASLGGVKAAAHTAAISVAMLCMVLGDVGSSLSQAFLPAFVVNSSSSSTAKTKEPMFDLEAAMPTVKQLLKCTLSISATVTVLAATVIGIFGRQITSDPNVLREMRHILPWVMATLCFHGSAVTLEGVLLSRKKFRGLTVNYSILAVSVAAFQIATRKFNLGLAGVWGCYLWFCCSRVVTFSALGGLLRLPSRQWWIDQARILRRKNDTTSGFQKAT